MTTDNPRTRAAKQDTGLDGGPLAPASSGMDWRTSIRLTLRACCCPAKPAVVVIMPPGPGRAAESELFLCRHHYAASERALASAAAAVFDASGEPLTPRAPALAQAG
jgi:hypothetical protein